MSELEELDLLIEHRQLTIAFLDAKKAYQADPDNEELRDAKVVAGEALRAHRAHWRGIRDWLKATDNLDTAVGDAIAMPETVALTTGVDQ